MKRQSWLSVGLTLLASTALADHISPVTNSATTSGPIVTISPETLPRQTFSFSALVQFQKFNTLSTDDLIEKSEATHTSVETIDYILQPTLSASYGITDNLMISAILPYVSRTELRHGDVHHEEAEEEGEEEEHATHVEGDSNGIGDLNLLAEWRLLKREKFTAALLAGISVPTGQTNIKDIEGIRFEGDHQPGTGAWNPSIGLAAAGYFNKSGLFANVLFTDMRKGANDTRLGNVFEYDLGFSHRFEFNVYTDTTASRIESSPHFHEIVDAILELNGTSTQKNFVNGEINPNTGGTIINLAPGIRIATGLRGLASSYLSVGIPIYQHLNGEQTKSRVSIVFGTSILLGGC